MAERGATHYRRLFEVRLLHHYWLDEGATVFDNFGPPAEREARLLAYDMRSFLAVRPTPATYGLLQGLRCLFRPTALGFVVAAPKTAAIAAGTVLSFVVSPVGSGFFRYTAMTLRPQNIQEIADHDDTTADRVTHRYKANVPVLSNLTGTTRGAGAAKALFLSRESPAPTANDQVEGLVRSGATVMQLISDDPGAATQELGAAASLPAYVNQADAPAIVAPPGIVGAPARGVELSSEIPDDVFALIRLTAVRRDDDDYSFVDGAGAAKPTPPVYEVRFRNRATFWSYRKKQDGAFADVELTALPLTHFGNAGTRQKPSAGIVNAEQTGVKVTRLISEIYV